MKIEKNKSWLVITQLALLPAHSSPQVYVTNGDLNNACAISLSLFLIVQTSVVLGTALPFALAKVGIDPANAGTSIQVRSGLHCSF